MTSLRPSAPRFLPGTIVGGKYRVERLLTEGTMGLVVEATDLDGEPAQPVAIKILCGGRPTAALEARFAREARIARRLQGHHVARVDAFGHTDAGDPFLAMELLTGRDLAAELAARGPLPVAEAVDAILEASAGVAEAHAAGLVHRDIKPANLFVSLAPRSSIKVLDFGLTGVPHEKGPIDLAATESNFGTPQYMAPEQIRSASHVDARTDQHALAAVLYEMLTGRPPFVAPDVTQLAVAIAVDPPPHARAARPEVPRALDAAIRRALGKQPEDRFPDVLGFAEAVAPFGGERGHDALRAVRAALSRRDAAPPHPQRGRARRGWTVTALPAVALLAVLGCYRLATHPAPSPASAASPASIAATSVATAETPKPPPEPAETSAASNATAATAEPAAAPRPTTAPSSARPKRADQRSAPSPRIVSR